MTLKNITNNMRKEYGIPKYYTNKALTEEEKRRKDWQMIGKDFYPLPIVEPTT